MGEHDGRGAFAGWLRLARPIPASLDDENMLLLDLGPSGALLVGRGNFEAGRRYSLSFHDGVGDIRVSCLITGVADHVITDERDLLVRFQDPGLGLLEFIARYQDQIHRAERANAEGDFAQNRIDGDSILSDLGSAARSNEPFLRCRISGGRWSCTVTASREQPPDGFTISAAESEDQIRLLQLAYEESDDDARDALREFAAVSLPRTDS